MNNLIERVSCKTADELLKALCPRGHYFGGSNPKVWVFRGHSDDNYQLVPSALRENSRLWDIEESKLKTNADQILAERTTLFNFFTHVDTQGLPIPEDSQQIRRIFNNYYHAKRSDLNNLESGKEVWPPDEILSFVGLAQHYGIPTRLLDWSRSSYKAALFAAKEAANVYDKLDDDEKLPSGQELAVWAIAPDKLHEKIKLASAAGKKVDLITVTVPRSENPNLHAQEGLFTLYRPSKVNLKEPIDRRPMDEILKETIGSVVTSARPIFYRFVLPISQSKKLLYLLAKEGIDSASLFPGYDGVVKAIFERPLWDRG